MPEYKSIDHIEESGPLCRLDKRNLPDLDLLMLDVYLWSVAEDMLQPWEEPWSYRREDGSLAEFGGDTPTYIPGGGYTTTGEADVGFYRKNPCACGGEHAWDMDQIDTDDDGNPVGRKARGAFLGVYFR